MRNAKSLGAVLLSATFAFHPYDAPAAAETRFFSDIAIAYDFGETNDVEPAPVDLSITTHIFNFSREARFGGDVVSHFASFSATPQPLWSEQICHQDRGFPHLDLRHVDGVVTFGQSRSTIMAVERVIGKTIPSDEVYLDQRLSPYQNGVQGGSSGQKTLRYKTSKSHLLITIRLLKVQC